MRDPVTWLFASRSPDPIDRAIEPLIRVAMVLGVVSSLIGLWLHWAAAVNQTLVLQYSLRSAPIQIAGLLASLAVLQRRGPVAATRVFGGFVVVTMSLTSIALGAETVSNSLPRLVLPIIVLAMALAEVESVIWLLLLLAGAWLGLALDPFQALSGNVQRAIVGRFVTATLVLTTTQAILMVMRRALRREVMAAAASALQIARTQRIDSLGRLAAGTAHDFNGLLGAILLTAEELEFARDASERSVAVDSIKELVRQSSDLTKRLLQFARGNAGDGHEYFSLHQSIDEAIEAVRPTFARRILIEREGAEVPAHVLGSRVEIRQVFTNLLMNAGDAIERDGTIRVAVNAAENGANRSVRVIIRDNGTGVDASVRPHLFEPFVSTKRADKGTGLGLSTAQAIVERHGGAINHDAAAPPPGATFVITLPVAPAPT